MSLCSGYSTGTYFCACVKAIVCKYNNIQNDNAIILPNNTIATIPTYCTNDTVYAIKEKNDDIDVTIGAKIIVKLTNDITKERLNPTPHNPTILHIGTHSLTIYAGEGLGVATKKGLKISPNSIAINPTPLNMVKTNLQNILQNDLTIVVSIQDGKILAHQTANPKVGIIGGISILGTSGIVKPISSSAYIDSIKEEISVIAHYSDTIAITLGNSAYGYAKSHYQDNIVEIGNFIYDSLCIINSYENIKNIVFITSIAKMTKVAQGFKNTHNRYGDIDFVQLKDFVQKQIGVELVEDFITVKGIYDYLDTISQSKQFGQAIQIQATKILQNWTKKNINTIIIEAKNGL